MVQVLVVELYGSVLFLQLPTVRVFEMSAHYANTGMEMLSPFVDSSVDNVLLQTNADFNQSLLEFINTPKRHLIDSQLHDSQTL